MSDEIERLSIRARPSGFPIMRQSWGKLLFAHWPIDAQLLRPLIPRRLSIDTFEGTAWIGVVPFTMWNVRPPFTPPIPGLSSFHELNVRTYVEYKGTPGVWFFSLDAAQRLAVWGARTFYHLPYFNARMELTQSGNKIRYASTRTHKNARSATLGAEWQIGGALEESVRGTLPFFLTERYCLYAAHREKLMRMRIFHPPWPLRRATLNSWESTMVESHGLPEPKGEPLLHYAERIDVKIWPDKVV